MIIRPLSTSIATLLFAPDTEGTPAGGGSTPAPAIAVSAADSPTGADIPVTPRTQSSPPVVIQEAGTQDPKTAPRVKQKGVETSAAKLLGLEETPQEEAAREAKEYRERDKSGRFTKQPEIGKKAAAAPAEPVKLGEPTPPVTPPPVPAPVVAKIKVGDKEMTPEEAAARIAELEKASTPSAIPTPPVVPEVPKDEAAIAAETKAREDKFIADHIQHYLMDAKDGGEYDQMLAGGPKGAEAFARMLAKAVMHSRQFTAARLSEARNEFDSITAGFQPLQDQFTLTQQYQSENQFLDANKDIKEHATGLQVMREVSHELHDEHGDLLALMAASPNSPNTARYQARAKVLENEFISELGKATRARLNIGAASTPSTTPPAPAATVPPAATPPKARPPAPTGNLGGSRAPVAKGNDGGFGDLAAKGFF